jgi:protein-S-isoprenylcysteine O-methyltransferase Ste14
MATLGRSIAVSTLFTLFGGPGIVLGLGPWLITRFRIPAGEADSRMILGAALITIGLMPLLESIVRFVVVGRGTLMPLVPPEHLVVSGLYRYMRNPMYVGVLTVLFSESIVFRSRRILTYAIVLFVFFDLMVILYEEPALKRKFGASYEEYLKMVPRWMSRGGDRSF